MGTRASHGTVSMRGALRAWGTGLACQARSDPHAPLHPEPRHVSDVKARPGEGSVVPCSVVARWTGLNARTIRRWIVAGKIAGFGVGTKRPRWFVSRADAVALRDGRAPPSRADRGEP